MKSKLIIINNNKYEVTCLGINEYGDFTLDIVFVNNPNFRLSDYTHKLVEDKFIEEHGFEAFVYESTRKDEKE